MPRGIEKPDIMIFSIGNGMLLEPVMFVQCLYLIAALFVHVWKHRYHDVGIPFGGVHVTIYSYRVWFFRFWKHHKERYFVFEKGESLFI